MAKFLKSDLLKSWAVRIVLFISLLVNGAFGWNYYSGNIVAKVFDGDTFELKNGVRARLLNLDSPEIGLCGAAEAKQRLEELVLGKFIILKEWYYEPYNRRQGLVYQGDQLINETMIKEGWGYYEYKQSSQNERFKSAYRFAKENKKGIFGLNCQLDEPTDKNCVIKGNIDEDTQKKFYYLSDCKDYDRVKINLDRGEKFFCNEKEAKMAGFTKASGCE